MPGFFGITSVMVAGSRLLEWIFSDSIAPASWICASFTSEKWQSFRVQANGCGGFKVFRVAQDSDGRGALLPRSVIAATPVAIRSGGATRPADCSFGRSADILSD
jgi:hypothetical protein